jgi:hypothetical protein
LAKVLFNAREQFAYLLRDAAAARIAADSTRITDWDQISIPRCLFEPHVEDTIQGIFRDGLKGLEHNIRFAVDEIVLEALNSARRREPRE